MNNPTNNALPELPEPDDIVEVVDRYNFCHNKNVYTADQMRAYGELCRASAGREAVAWRTEVCERLGMDCAAGLTWTPQQVWEHVNWLEGRARRKNETMVELFPGLPKLPRWLFDYAGEIARYMTANHPGQWAIDGIESRGYTPTAPELPKQGEYNWDAAHEALESMDDYARMDKGVNPYGPYAVLRDLLTKAKGWKQEADELRALAKKAEGA